MAEKEWEIPSKEKRKEAQEKRKERRERMIGSHGSGRKNVIDLPKEYKDTAPADVKKEIKKLQSEVDTVSVETTKKQQVIDSLKNHLVEQGEDCKHENLVADGPRYKCTNPECGEIVDLRRGHQRMR